METVNTSVKDRFEREATVYEELITKLVPLYKQQSELVGFLVKQLASHAVTCMDLGCGTGDLGRTVLLARPDCNVTFADYSPEMLTQAKLGLAAFSHRTRFVTKDFTTDALGQADYDLVVSGFAIHHFPSLTKEAVYRKVYDALRPGGWFIHRELVAGVTRPSCSLFEEIWADHLASHGEDRETWIDGHRHEDMPDPLPMQLDMLKKIGFEEVTSWFQWGPFVIFGGQHR